MYNIYITSEEGGLYDDVKKLEIYKKEDIFPF